ncbi:hypothetical protein [Terrimonas sp.]|uniref:hypothetical protein n=1 Tax=Terrimonas sp. TaxID=1914338 RepID=UPI001057378A|nr:hypothetical protein [Terrimonas sp.]
MHTLHPQTKILESVSVKAWRSLFILLLLFYSYTLFSQTSAPTFKLFQPIEPGKSPQFQQSSPLLQPQRLKSILPNDPYEQQNNRIRQQSEINPAQLQRSPNNYLPGENRREQEYMYKIRSGIYQQHLDQLMQMNPDEFSITKAVYLTESTWYDNPPSFEEFDNKIKKYVTAVKQLLQREGLSLKNNTAINYGVQQLYKKDNTYYDKQSGKTNILPKLSYDFNDYMGDNDYRNMFVGKLVNTGKGQCHSLPLLYLCIVEQLGGKAYLSLSPNHSFIQHFDGSGKRYNFETTNGNHVTESWMMQSSFVSAAALANETYLDTLSSRQLYAQILSDLLLEYRMELGHDAVINDIIQKIQDIDPGNMVALLEQAIIATSALDNIIRASGYPPPSEIKQYPAIEQAYYKMQDVYKKLDDKGFQEMPPEIYQRWLKSMEEEAQKQQAEQEYNKLLQELKKLKKTKPTFKNTPKK